MAEPLASAKGLAFQLDMTSPDLTIETDAVKFRQVLLNLISNAVKYTETGHRHRLESDARDGEVDFRVARHRRRRRRGASRENLRAVLAGRADDDATVGGTGLGLAVTRQFVDLLGGKISVSSSRSAREAFYVTLPSLRRMTRRL